MKNCHFNLDIVSEKSPGKLSLVIPIKTISESRCTEHWSKKHKRHKMQQNTIRYYFLMADFIPKLPCHIVLTRIAPRQLDFDNLTMSFKWILDSVCDQLIPGLAPGRADGDKRITVEYRQEKGEPKEYGVKILIIEK